MLDFINNWGVCNQSIILKSLNINSPEQNNIQEVIVKGIGFSISFTSTEGRYWSLSFCEAVFKDLELEFDTEIQIPDSLRELTKTCFGGLPCHFGFVGALEKGETITVKLRK